MAKLRKPLSFSEFFGVEPKRLERLGVFNPTLNVDTRLFIDPLLLGESRAREIRTGAVQRFRAHFENIVTLLKASKSVGDLPWREAARRFSFHEIRHTCLGYGATSTAGSAFGPELRSRLLRTAKAIVDLGVEDPRLFLLLPLLEESVGPDRISDMTTNVILSELCQYTERVSKVLAVQTARFQVNGTNFDLPRNPSTKKSSPVLLVPRDVLRDLPIATDWEDVCDAAAKNAQLRRRVNEHIGNIWQIRAKKDKAKTKQAVLGSEMAARALLDSVLAVAKTPYDLERDPLGEVRWRDVRSAVREKFPWDVPRAAKHDVESVHAVVMAIVERFRFLVEEKGLWKELWNGSRPRSEASTQRLFFAVADAYCAQSGVDISPELDTGTGRVDFKFSVGREARVLVETKLSTNPKTVSGYEKQLEAYKTSEETKKGVYLVVDLGRGGTWEKRLLELQNRARGAGKCVSDLVVVDGRKQRSASKR